MRRFAPALPLALLLALAYRPAARAQSEPVPLVVPPEALGRPVSAIHVDIVGAERTKPHAVVRLMQTRVGAPLDRDVLERDLIRIRATQMLYETRVTVEPLPAGPRIALQMRDKWAVFVYAGIRRGGARTITRVGLSDANVLGRLFSLVGEINSGAEIPFVAKSSADRIGSALHAVVPRVSGTPLTPSLSWVREFFDFAVWNRDYSVGLVYDRARSFWRGALLWELSTRTAIALSAATTRDEYQLNSLSRVAGAVPPSARSTVLGLELQLGYVDEWLSRTRGWQANFALEGGRRDVLGADDDVARASFAIRTFLNPRPRHVLGLHLSGISTTGRTDSYLARAGGLYEIRGFRDATFLAQRIARTNVEYRVEIFELPRPLRTITQAVAFVDGGYVDGRAGGIAGLDYEGPVVSAGAGLRANVVPLARAIGRVDFAFALHPLRRFDLAFGVQQFF